MQLGSEQRKLLAALGSPTCAMVVPDKVALSLVRRGLLRVDDGAFACITPKGLRTLADEMEAGRVEGAHEWAKRKREEKVSGHAA